MTRGVSSTSDRVLFWDLDGTITDPRFGIVDAYQAFLKEWGAEAPSAEDLLWVIGPPLRDCIRKLLKTDDTKIIEQAVTRYRYWYVEEGFMYRDTPYEGIRELLTTLAGRGQRMFIATAKAHTYARKILVHWGLAEYFEGIHGSELDGTRSNKADLLKWMMETYGLKAGKHIVMIGDRKHDALAGQTCGLSTIGVGYGYGSLEELTGQGVDHYISTVAELARHLIPS